MNRVLLHCDMNNYFASVEEKYNPALRSVPFAVCGDPEMRHNIVMAKNALAKNAGVITGISYYQAKQVCPNLGYVKANYTRYLKETKLAREIYLKYTDYDRIIPYGMDEAWVDLSETVADIDTARQIADVIRLEIKYSMGLSASVGVSFNYIFSKLGSDLKKPNATTVITRENYKEIVWPLPASELLFVGAKRKKALDAIGIKTIGDIAKSDPERLSRLLGVVGHNIWQFANGDDRSFKPQSETVESVGNTITPPADLNNVNEASAIIYMLAASISKRLRNHNLKARCVSVCIKDSKFNSMVRQCRIYHPTDSVNVIFNKAFELFTKNYTWENPLRSVGVRVDKLTQQYEQLSLVDFDDCEISFDIDGRVKELVSRLGELKVEKTATSKEW